MSKVKSNLVLILQSEIEQLHNGVVQMDEESLIKQVAKHKVLYNLTSKSNELNLIYSYIALSEFYVNNEYYEAAIKNLNSAKQIKQTGDIYYLLAISYLNLGKKQAAIKCFEGALKEEWIEPSKQHEKSNKLQSISYIQKIIFEKISKKPQKVEDLKEKLISLSYDKVKITQQWNEQKNEDFSQNYYYALAMADLSSIYEKFSQYDKALQKINTSISIFEYSGENRQKLIEFYYCLARIQENMGNHNESKKSLQKSMQIIRVRGEEAEGNEQTKKMENEIYYMLIRKNVGL